MYSNMIIVPFCQKSYNGHKKLYLCSFTFTTSLRAKKQKVYFQIIFEKQEKSIWKTVKKSLKYKNIFAERKKKDKFLYLHHHIATIHQYVLFYVVRPLSISLGSFVVVQYDPLKGWACFHHYRSRSLSSFVLTPSSGWALWIDFPKRYDHLNSMDGHD